MPDPPTPAPDTPTVPLAADPPPGSVQVDADDLARVIKFATGAQTNEDYDHIDATLARLRAALDAQRAP